MEPNLTYKRNDTGDRLISNDNGYYDIEILEKHWAIDDRVEYRIYSEGSIIHSDKCRSVLEAILAIEDYMKQDEPPLRGSDSRDWITYVGGMK